jgi:hypothetical protein
VTTLEALERVLGGVIRIDDGQRWLDTKIGDLQVAVIEQVRPLTQSTIFDLALRTPSGSEQDLLTEARNWYHLDHDHSALPRLPAPYVFTGASNGILFATTSAAPSLEDIIATLWSLAAIAREDLPAPSGEDPEAAANVRRARRVLWRIAFVAGVVLLVTALRSCG